MAITPQQIAAAAALELPRFFDDTVEQLLTGEGNYIRDAMPASTTAAIGQAVARAACRQYAAKGPDAVGTEGQRFENACRPYLESLSPGRAPIFEQPVVGGQCDGQFYSFNLSTATRPNAPSVSPLLRAEGPLNTRVLDVPASNGNDNGTREIQIFCRRFWFNGAAAPASGPPAWRFYATQTTSPGGVITSKIINLVNTSTGNDNCGQLPPIVRPPLKTPDPVGPSFRFNPSPLIDIPITVDVGPGGDITFDIGTGPITVDPFPDAPAGGGAGGSGMPAPGDVGDAGVSAATGLNGQAEGDAPPGKVLTGLKIGLTVVPESAREFRLGVFRAPCYIYMGTSEGLDNDPAGALLEDGQFVFADKEYLTKWRVNANVGFNVSVTPYYREATTP